MVDAKCNPCERRRAARRTKRKESAVNLKSDLKIGVFAYDWPHYKTERGLLTLCTHGYRPNIVFLQGRKLLKFRAAGNIRIAPKFLPLNSPQRICDSLRLDYLEDDHDSAITRKTITNLGLDVGIVLGARILKPVTIAAFNIGIVNMHPGIIPLNRGLDNIVWAIHDCIKQGVTTHLIDKRVDMGQIIARRVLAVHPDDSLQDIYLGLIDLEMTMMLEALSFLEGEQALPSPMEDKGTRYAAMPPEFESVVMAKFDYYKRYYDEMRGYDETD